MIKRDQSVWDTHWRDYKKIDVHDVIIDIVKKYAKGDKVLEVGFGTGGDLDKLSMAGFVTVGLDKSGVSVKNALKNGLHFKPVLGDAEAMPFKDKVFDVVFHQGVLEHFKNPNKFIYQQWRVLKNDGLLVVDVPQKWNLFTVYKKIKYAQGKWYAGWERSYSEKELRELLITRGFEVVQVKYYGVWPHQLGKFFYPQTISSDNKRKKLFEIRLIRTVSKLFRFLYEKNNIFRTLNSYNLIVIARKRRVKIAVDARVLSEGGSGIYRYAKQLRTLNKNRDYEITLIKKPKKYKYHRVLWEQLELYWKLKKVNADLYHAISNWGVPIFYMEKSILTIHDLIPLQDIRYFNNSKNELMAKLIYKFSIYTSVVKAKSIITTTSENKANIHKLLRVPFIKIEIIPMGVSESLFGVNRSKNYFLYHGGIAKRKNIGNLIEAFAIYSNSNSKTKLYITGDNKMEITNLKNKAKRLGIDKSIKFVGKVSDNNIEKLVRYSKVVVYPTLCEGFGMPVLEAMAASKPVVASDLKNIRYFAKNIPYYVDPTKANSIAQGMFEASNTNRDRLNRGMEIAKNYTWSNVLDKTATLYKSIIFNLDNV